MLERKTYTFTIYFSFVRKIQLILGLKIRNEIFRERNLRRIELRLKEPGESPLLEV